MTSIHLGVDLSLKPTLGRTGNPQFTGIPQATQGVDLRPHTFLFWPLQTFSILFFIFQLFLYVKNTDWLYDVSTIHFCHSIFFALAKKFYFIFHFHLFWHLRSYMSYMEPGLIIFVIQIFCPYKNFQFYFSFFTYFYMLRTHTDYYDVSTIHFCHSNFVALAKMFNLIF